MLIKGNGKDNGQARENQAGNGHTKPDERDEGRATPETIKPVQVLVDGQEIRKRPEHYQQYEYWRTHGKNINSTAREFGHSRATIYRWMRAEYWEEQSLIDIAADATEQQDEIVRHRLSGRDALEKARKNHAGLQQVISLLQMLLSNKMVDIVQKANDDEAIVVESIFDQRMRSIMEMYRRLVQTDADVVAKLYGIPQVIALDVEATGATAGPVPANIERYAAEAAQEIMLGLAKLGQA